MALPSATKPIKTRFVLKIKGAVDATIERFVSLPTGRGFIHGMGVDVFEAFSPVAGVDAVETNLAVSTIQEWRLQALDKKRACINNKL